MAGLIDKDAELARLVHKEVARLRASAAASKASRQRSLRRQGAGKRSSPRSARSWTITRLQLTKLEAPAG